MSKNITIARLNTLVTANAAQFTQEMDKAAKYAKSRGSMINKAMGGVSAFAGKLGIGLSVGGIIAFGRSVFDLGGQIVDLASQANLSTDAFQAFRAAAMENGATGEEVATMFAKMRGSVQAAVEGNKSLSEAFAKLGMPTRSLKQLAPERQFELIAKAIFNAKDQQEAYNAAAAIFGERIAPKMMQFLQAVASDGFDKLADGIKNVRLSPEQLKTLDDAGDKLSRMWDTIKLIGAHGIVGLAKGASINDLDQINARIRMLEELKKQGKVEYTVNGQTAKIDAALKNFMAARDRVTNPEAGQAFDSAKASSAIADQAKDRADAIFRNLEQERDRASKITADLSLFFSDMDEQSRERIESASKMMPRIPPGVETPTDAYSRLGLLTGDGATTEPKRQTALLEKIHQDLQNLLRHPGPKNQQPPAAYSN